MVNIPTSRDVAYVNPRSGRIAPSGPSVNVGAALQNLGEGIQQAAYNLNDLRTAEERDNQVKLGYDIETKLTEFRAAEEELFNKARESSSESGIGFTRSFLEGHQKRANDFIKANFAGVSEAQNANGRKSLLGLGNSLYAKAYDYEQKAKTNFYDRTTNSGLDTIRTQIRSNAAPFEDLKKQGIATIDAADMPEPWKAERRALWESDAAESKWRWKYEQNPQEAISDLRPSGTKNFIRKEEGFRAEPYWDTNAWRIGYGSDTVTLPDGSHVPVKPGMKITREDAERDLRYRLSEREGAQARRQIGDQWGSLGVNMQAALESVAYNYGSLPNSVVKAVKTGDSEQVAQAIEALPANPDRRKREAALVRGQAQVEIEDEYAGLDYDRREALASWGQSQYDQMVNKQRAAAKDRYSLLIATEPQNIDQKVILNDSSLDDGDKATLINSLNAAMKDRGATDALLGALSRGSVSVNPFDAEQRKAADSAYERLLGATETTGEQQAITNDFVTRTGYVPKQVQAELRRGAYSTDPMAMSQAMEAGLSLSRLAPAGFNFEGSADVQKKMDVYRALTRDLGYSAEEAGRKLVAANDPEQAARRDALVKSKAVADELKKIDASTVASVFDKGWLSPAPSLGANPSAEAAMVADYKSLLEESIVDANGDMEAAKKAASERMQRIYGVSDFSTLGNTVIRYPVEKAYPAGPDGTHEWIRSQAIEALKEDGVTTDEVFLMPMADGTTEKDIRAGKPARYQVLYKDQERGTIESLNVPFFADHAIERQRQQEEQRQRMIESERRMLDSRERSRGFRQSLTSGQPNPPVITTTTDRNAMGRRLGIETRTDGPSLENIREIPSKVIDATVQGTAPMRRRGVKIGGNSMGGDN